MALAIRIISTVAQVRDSEDCLGSSAPLPLRDAVILPAVTFVLGFFVYGQADWGAVEWAGV